MKNGSTANAAQPGSFLPAKIRFGHRYVDIFGVTPEGRAAIDYRRFHETEAAGG